MELKKKKLINIGIILILVILFILLLLAIYMGVSLAKYKRSVTSSGYAEIAKPIFVVESDNSVQIDGIEDSIYNFTVKNFNSAELSDVNLKYYIEIVNNSEADLEFELRNKEGQLLELTDNKTGEIELNSEEKDEDSYTLTIKYNNNAAITEDITGNVQVIVEAVQAEVL